MKTYFDRNSDIKAKCNSRSMAWQLIHGKCKERGIPAPLLDDIYEVVPVYLWETFTRILEDDSITGFQASRIYAEAYRDLPDFEEWAKETHGATSIQAQQLHKECESARDAWQDSVPQSTGGNNG